MTNLQKIKITERGWAGHFCASHHCGFRRNTLIEKGKNKIIVSTVGNYNLPGADDLDKKIGYERYYETMVFKAKKVGIYWEADVTKEVPFESPWAINELETETDQKANDMHENVVREIADLLSTQE